jgi:CrcB protein
LRYAADELLPSTMSGLPWATLTVNVVGSFALAALLVVVFESTWSIRYLREFAGIGLLGSLTTFSTMSVELRYRAAATEWGWLSLYLALSIGLGLAAAALGAVAARMATTRRRR